MTMKEDDERWKRRKWILGITIRKRRRERINTRIKENKNEGLTWIRIRRVGSWKKERKWKRKKKVRR